MSDTLTATPDDEAEALEATDERDPDALLAKSGPPCFNPPGNWRLRHLPSRVTPNPKQAYFLSTTCKELFFGGAGGGGKSVALLMGALQFPLDVETPVPTPTGWSNIGSLREGDTVFTPDGGTATVTGKTAQCESETYRITFSDGSSIVADGNHQWAVHSFTDRMAEGGKWYPTKRPLQIKSTLELRDSIRTLHERPTNNWSIPNIQPVDLPEADLPLDPYVFGVWLGDGSKRDGTIAGVDDEIFEHVEAAGFPVTLYGQSVRHARGLRSVLTSMGVRNDKHVPAEYLRASSGQRLALVQGLMDTDGSVDRRYGSCRFFNTDPKIIDAIVELLRSLGVAPQVCSQRYQTPKAGVRAGQLVTFSTDLPAFRLKRKLALQRLDKPKRERIIRSIEPAGRRVVQCIAVDSPEHLFVAGQQWVQTHNCDVPGYSALILRRSLTDLTQPGALISIAHDWLDDNPAAKYNANERKWTFNTGPGNKPAVIQFGYLSHLQHIGRYRGAEYHYIAWDELGEFPHELPYKFLFSRVRRPKGLSRDAVLERFGAAEDGTTLLDIPLRVRGASNPGGPGMAWVKKRLVDADTRVAPFIPATFLDNPAIDPDEYRAMLAMLPEVERRRMELGDWTIQEIPGALWKLDDIRHSLWERFDGVEMFERVYVGLDPSVGGGTEAGDECGIVAGGKLADGRVIVLADESLRAAPVVWAQRAVALHHSLHGSGIVIERNQGHELLRTQIRDAADQLHLPQPPVLLANARGSKEFRAGTVSPGYTQPSGAPLVVHASALKGGELEAQMVGWIPGASKAESVYKSPDRVDALVWCLRGLLYPDSIDDFSVGGSADIANLVEHLSQWRR